MKWSATMLDMITKAGITK